MYFSRFYDKEIHQMDIDEWSEKFGDDSYKIVQRTNIGNYLVSTAWIGMNLVWDRIFDRPMIFETMVFMDDGEESPDFGVTRYNSEKDAMEGHAIVCVAVEEFLKEKKLLIK